MSTEKTVNILMVDDQPAKLLSYEVMLGGLGENLIKANSAREALEILLKTEVAVVLMDVSMPDLDGFQLADMIRQHPRFQRTAIIFISAVHLTDLDQLKGYEYGAVDYYLCSRRSRIPARESSRLRRSSPQDPPARNSQSRTRRACSGTYGRAAGQSRTPAASQYRTIEQEPGTGCHRQDGSRHHFQPPGRWPQGLHQRSSYEFTGAAIRLCRTASAGSIMFIPTITSGMGLWMRRVESGELRGRIPLALGQRFLQLVSRTRRSHPRRSRPYHEVVWNLFRYSRQQNAGAVDAR